MGQPRPTTAYQYHPQQSYLASQFSPPAPVSPDENSRSLLKTLKSFPSKPPNTPASGADGTTLSSLVVRFQVVSFPRKAWYDWHWASASANDLAQLPNTELLSLNQRACWVLAGKCPDSAISCCAGPGPYYKSAGTHTRTATPTSVNNNSNNRRNIRKHSALNHQQPQHRQPRHQQSQENYHQNPPPAHPHLQQYPGCQKVRPYPSSGSPTPPPGLRHRKTAAYPALGGLRFSRVPPIRHPTPPASNIITSFRFNASRDTDLARSHAQRLEWSPAKPDTRERHLPQPQDHRLS